MQNERIRLLLILVDPESTVCPGKGRVSRTSCIFTLSGFMHLSVYRAREVVLDFIRNFFTDILKNHYICNGN